MQESSARAELQRAQASLSSQMRKWHEERLARKREQLRQQAPTAAAAMAARAQAAASHPGAASGAPGAAPSGTVTSESAIKHKKGVDLETIGLLHKSLEVRWSSQHVQHDAKSLRRVFGEFGEVVHVSMRGKRRNTTSHKAVVVMASSSAASAAAAHGVCASAHCLVTPLPKVVNLDSLPVASPEVLEAAAATLRRAGVQTGADPQYPMSSRARFGGTPSSQAAAPASAAFPSYAHNRNTPDSLTAVLASAAAAAAASDGGAASHAGGDIKSSSDVGGNGPITSGTPGHMAPTSVPFPPSFPSFARRVSSGAGPSGTTAGSVPSLRGRLDGSDLEPGIPSSFPVAGPFPSSTTQATDTPFGAPANRLASSSAAVRMHSPSNADTSDLGGGWQGGSSSMSSRSHSLRQERPTQAATAVADAGALGLGMTGRSSAADALPAQAFGQYSVRKQIDREKLRAQRLAELEEKGSEDEDVT
jgi:hypothetical protein